MRYCDARVDVDLETAVSKVLSQFDVAYFLVATRFEYKGDGSLLYPESAKFLSDRREYVEKQFCATTWPGTRLIDHCGLVAVLSPNYPVLNDLEQFPNCSDWVGNNLMFEDLCLVDGTRGPVLISISHENEILILEDELTLDLVSMEDCYNNVLMGQCQDFFCIPETGSVARQSDDGTIRLESTS